jgi:hypothetical protein
MYTIDDVVKGKCTSEDVWSQFVTPELEMQVIKNFSLHTLLESKDKYFHNIPLDSWKDFAEQFIRDKVSNTETFKAHLAGDNTAPSRWKASEDGVCIAKQAARQAVRRVLSGRGDEVNLARFTTMPWTPGSKL